MFKRRFRAAALIAALLACGSLGARDAQANPVRPSIVLVHGAWADASSWDGVIKELRREGYTVYAPPNPLRGVASDASALGSFLKSVSGPVILVGHSYGGAVISAAAPSDPNVKALVYVDAFVPDTGESCLGLLASAPPPPKDLFVPVPIRGTSRDADLYLAPKYYPLIFASDLPHEWAAVLAITQRPVTASALNEKASSTEGWKTLPSWFVIGDADLVIPPSVQLFMARRAKSHISHVPHGSHPSMIEHPEETVQAIRAAIAATR